jgi:uncharacterized phage-associated protein
LAILKGKGGVEMASTPALRVADYFVRAALDRGDGITNLKLQKLLYYAQAWFLAFYDRPVFPEPIEAWVHGPVVAVVFRRFKDYRWNPIAAPAGRERVAIGVDAHLNEVLRVYGSFSATELERMTHFEGPWRAARGGIPDHLPSRAEIPHKLMRDYYRKRLDAGQQEGQTYGVHPKNETRS